MLREEVERVAREAAKNLREMRGKSGLDEVLGYHEGDPSRRVDRLSEDYILDSLRNLGYDFLVVTEESGTIGRKEHEMIALVDPLDGSTNFVSGIPWSSVSIAVYRSDDFLQSTAGAVVSVNELESYSYDESGVYHNSERLGEVKGRNANVILSYFDETSVSLFSSVYQQFKGHKVRSLGCASMDMIITCLGRVRAMIELRGRLRNVDIAASSSFCVKLGKIPFDIKGRPLSAELTKVDTFRYGVITAFDEETEAKLRKILSEIEMNLGES